VEIDMTPEELFEKLISKVEGVQDRLDDLVVDGFITDATNLCNEGLSSQLEYLLQYDTLDGLLAQLDLPENINPLTGDSK
jgi:hypothetical protein